MIRRRMLLGFLLYLTLDLSSPFVAGAFTFDPDSCVEAIHRASSSAERTDASAVSSRTPVVRLELPSPSSLRPLTGRRHAILDWLVDTRAHARTAADPPMSPDDH